jgi:arylsulfatase A
MKSSMTFIAAVVLASGAALHGADTKEAKPNIVIILADDMGYGDPGSFNPHSKIATPQIDSLASAGLKFTDAHASGPLCHPSRYGLITGRYPFRTDVSKWPTQPLIRKDQVTLASLLKSQGYQTAMVGKWHLGFQEKGYDRPLTGGPVDHGFDTFFGTRASTDIPPYFWIRADRAVEPPTKQIAESHSAGWAPIQGAFMRGGEIAPEFVPADVLPRLTDEAVKLIRAHAGKAKPLFLYLALTAPHTPWLPAADFAGKSGAGMYGDFVMMVDAEIGRVLTALDQAGMSKTTLLIFTSDNGPVWYPEDVAKFGHDAEGGWRGMKGDLWEAGHRMPFIVRWPGHVKAGTVTAQTICFTDLLATFADLCGVELPAATGPDSFSILPVLEGRQPEGAPIRGPIVMQAGSSSAMMIRWGDWKLINQLGSGGFSKPTKLQSGPGDPAGQLYDLSKDSGERTNQWSAHPEIVARLTKLLEKCVADGRTTAGELQTNDVTVNIRKSKASSKDDDGKVITHD